MVVDCGASNYLLFSNTTMQPVSLFYDAIELSLGSRANLGFRCMGVHDVILPAGVNLINMIQPDYVGISQYLVFGLAGLVCAGFVVYAILKNA